MKRNTLKLWAIGATGILVLFGLLVFIMEQLDNRRPSVVQPPDMATSYVETLDLGDLVASATPPALELQFVTQGSGAHSGDFKDDLDPSVYPGVLLQVTSSRSHIEFELATDAETRATLLSELRDATRISLSRWQPMVEVHEARWPEGAATPEGFLLEYRAVGEAGDYEGKIKVTIEQMSENTLRPHEAGKEIYSLSVTTSEDRWGRE